MMTRSLGGFDAHRLRVNRATGRAVVAIAENVAVETKRQTHVITGTLRRSIHAAPVGYDGSSDEGNAKTGDLMLMERSPQPEHTPFGPAVEVGSWLPYACVEWIGRGHPGITQGMEAVRGAKATAIVAEAFKQEGL